MLNMDKSAKHVVNERHMRVHTVRFHLWGLQKQATLINVARNQNGGCLGAGERNGREHEETCRGDGDVYLNLGNGSVHVSNFIKLYTLRLVHFAAYKLHLDKA